MLTFLCLWVCTAVEKYQRKSICIVPCALVLLNYKGVQKWHLAGGVTLRSCAVEQQKKMYLPQKNLFRFVYFMMCIFLAPIHFLFFKGLQLFVDLACCFCSYVSRCCMSYHGCSLTPIMRVRGEREIDRWIGAAVMWTLGKSIMVKREQSRKVKLSICLLIYDPNLTYGRKLFVVTGHVPPGWDTRVDPGHTGENIFFSPG